MPKKVIKIHLSRFRPEFNGAKNLSMRCHIRTNEIRPNIFQIEAARTFGRIVYGIMRIVSVGLPKYLNSPLIP